MTVQETPARAPSSGIGQLKGWTHGLALGIALALAGLTIAVFIAAMPTHIRWLRTISPDDALVLSEQLTANKLAELESVGISLEDYVRFRVGFLVVNMALWTGLGLLLFRRRSNNLTALLVGLMLISQYAANPSHVLAISDSPWRGAAEIVNDLSFVTIVIVWFIFPDGRFVPRLTKWLFFLFPVYIFGESLFPDLFPSLNNLPGPVEAAIFIGLILTILLSQLYRYRAVSSYEHRQQTRLVVFTALLVFGLMSLITVMESAGFVFSPWMGLIRDILNSDFALMALMAAFAVALLRHRLFDIDALVRKTTLYVFVTGLLALVYFGIVVVLQRLLSPVTGDSDVVVVLSTLAIAALFLPLRRRIQDFIDRRFYRRKYNAEKVLAQFAATVRDETDLDALTAELLRVIQETMEPESIYLWLRNPGQGYSMELESNSIRTISSTASRDRPDSV